MEPKELPTIWSQPDLSRLTPKQISIRLPLEVSAKISALSDLYPRKAKTEIIGDLLASALDQMEKALPTDDVEPLGFHPETKEPIFPSSGVQLRYRNLTEKYLAELEKELGVHQAVPVPESPDKGKKNNRTAGKWQAK
jgi:predicted DNA-binding protein